MTDNQLFALCGTVVALAFLGLVAYRMWLDSKGEDE